MRSSGLQDRPELDGLNCQRAPQRGEDRQETVADVDLEREFEAGGLDTTAYLNVQNFFNAKGQVYENSAVQGIHYPVPAEQDIMGRYFTLGIRVNM